LAVGMAEASGEVQRWSSFVLAHLSSPCICYSLSTILHGCLPADGGAVVVDNDARRLLWQRQGRLAVVALFLSHGRPVFHLMLFFFLLVVSVAFSLTSSFVPSEYLYVYYSTLL